MGLWEDFTDTISRGFDQVNPWDNGKDWNNRVGNPVKKKDEEQAGTPQVSQPNFRMQPQTQAAPQPAADFGVDKLNMPSFGQVDEKFQAPKMTLDTRLNADGTVADTRPMPAQVPNQQTDQANSALKAATTVKDRNNYVGSDADKLRAELLKPNPDKAIIQGLTQSVRNRVSERERAAPEEARVAEMTNPLTVAQETLGAVGQVGKTIAQGIPRGIEEGFRSTVLEPLVGNAGVADPHNAVSTASDKNTGIRAFLMGEDPVQSWQEQARQAQIAAQQSDNKFIHDAAPLAPFIAPALATLNLLGTKGGGDIAKPILDQAVRLVEHQAGRKLSEIEAVSVARDIERAIQDKSGATAMNAGLKANGSDTVVTPEGVVRANQLNDPETRARKQYIQDTSPQRVPLGQQPSDPIDDLSHTATNSLFNDTTGMKPGGVERSGRYVENGTAKPVEIRRLEDGSTVIVDGRHTLEYARQNGITDYPIVDVTERYAPKRGTNVNSTAPLTAAEKLADQATVLSDKSQQLVDQADAGIAQRKTEDLANAQLELERLQHRLMDTATPEDQIPMLSRQVRELKDEINGMTVAPQPKANPIPHGTIDEQGNLINTDNGEYLNTPEPEHVPNPALEGLNNAPGGTQATDMANGTSAGREAVGESSRVSNGEFGKMAETFYDSRQGNQSIKFRDVEALGKQISNEADVQFKAIGSDFASVARKVQEAEAAGVRTLDGVDLTAGEKQLWLNVESEMDYVRRRASLGKREISPKDRGEMYFPHQVPGTYELKDSLFAGFRDVKPGNEITRKTGQDALGLDEIDYSPEVIGRYITRYSDTKLLNEERIARAVEKRNPDAPVEARTKATRDIVALQDKTNRQETKITVGGLGKKVTVTDGEAVDFAGDMAQIGKDLGRQQTEAIGTPKGFTNGDRVNSVYVGDKTLGDHLGLNQHRDAASYAGKQTAEAAGDRDVLAGLVQDRLTKEYNLPEEDVAHLVDSIARIKTDLPDELVRARVAATYASAAKQQMMEQLQDTVINNAKLRKDVSDLVKQIIREGSTESKLSAKIIQGTLRTTNALFRKFNVSSALNELSDFTSFTSIFGRDMAIGMAAPKYSLIKTYGLGELDPSIEPYIKQVSDGKSFKEVASQINSATNLYKFVEHYKAASLLTAAERHYGAKGLTGDALTKQVLKDYREIAIPRDAFTKTFLDNYPLYTQYMSWGALNIRKEARMAAGKIDAGVMQDKSQAARIARNLYANLPAKTVFWLASNGLKGTAILGAIGLTDFTGATNQDYSGIAEEDKSWYDQTTQHTNVSTVMSLVNTVVQSVEKENLKNSDKYKNADYNPYANTNAVDSISNTLTPQVVKNAVGSFAPSKGEFVGGTQQMMDKGYSENAAGRVQYAAPTNPFEVVKSYVFGKNQTANARDYSGRQNIAERVQNGQNPLTALGDMAGEQLGIKQGEYNRPLTDDYTKAYKAANNITKTAILDGGRAYNKTLDTLKKNSPEAYNRYIEALDGNHVNPEYWKNILGGSPEKADLSVFKMIGERKKQLKKDLGTAYDPLYDLPDDQARSVMQLKSAATGDDIPLRNSLGKEGWYKDYKKKINDYFAAKGDATPSDFTETARVKQWNDLDTQLQSFYYDKTSGDKPVWADIYPLVFQSKQLTFNSPESKAFYKANADAYKAEKQQFDKAQLGVINQMRGIEGHPEMGWEQYQQATNIKDTSGATKQYGSGNSTGRTTVGIKGSDFGSSKGGAGAINRQVKITKVARKVKVRPGIKGGKITVTKGK